MYASHFIKANGIQLHYVTAGEGPPLILLHGFPEFWYSWRKQIPELAKHYKVFAPDLRGYNKSDAPANINDYSLNELVKDIKEFIQNLGYEKAIVVAHDWGAGVAWSLAWKHPEVIEKLVILNMPYPAELKKQLTKNMRQLMRSWYMFFFQIPFLPEFLLKLNLRYMLKQSFQGWCYNKDAFTDEDIEEYVKVYSQPGKLTPIINYYRALFRYPLKVEGKKPGPILKPVLLIWGENDKALGKELTYNTNKYCKGPLEIKYIPNCSHWVQHEQPELVNQYILDFLKAH